MKKLIAMAAALAVTSLSAFAVDITVGARGNFNMGIGTDIIFQPDTFNSFEKHGGNLGGGFAVFANFGRTEIGKGSLGIQPEFGMNFNNGYTSEEDPVKMNLYSTTIDLPVLVTFNYPVMEAFSIGCGLGPYLSIPSGFDFLVQFDEDSSTKTFENMDVKARLNFGFAFDVNAAYKLGPGSLVFDVRYMLDLEPTSIDSKDPDASWHDRSNDMFTRRMFVLGLGYQMKF